MNTVEALRERLVALDWTFGIDETREETKARIALFREFLRRSAPYSALHSARPAAWPFFDAAARVDPAVRAPESVTDEIAAKVPQLPASAVRNTCVSALHFAALLDSGKFLQPPYQDPFAPLVYMHELGGAFGRDGAGLIEIGIATVGFDTPVTWLEKPPPPGLPDFPDLAGRRLHRAPRPLRSGLLL